MGGNPVLSVRSWIVGRSEDVRVISEFFEKSSGRGLHVLGDAGVGKTTLLDAVAEVAAESGAWVLRADGVEFEADVAYAGLHQILTPLLDRAGELPAEHRTALDVALGFGTGPAPDRLLVVNAVLALLRLAAVDGRVLLVVDDLPWLDQASAVVLGFVARRLAGTRIGFLAASRTSVHGPLDRGGLTEFELAPLDVDSAHLLLGARIPGLAAKVRTRVITEAEGNPLALLELPGQLSRSQLAANEELPTVLSLGKRTRCLYASRVRVLPAADRRMLLLAALAHTGDLGVLCQAAALIEPDPDSDWVPGPDTAKAVRKPASVAEMLSLLAAAERDRLVRVDTVTRRLVFHHPLIRSTVVDIATLAERRRAHLALAAASVDRAEVRAWHLAEAAIEPDETVAKLLQEAAHTVLRRGDTVGAVAGLIRAADLSPDLYARNRRLVEAAYVGAEASGDIAKASDLLRRAQGESDMAAELGTSGALYAAAAAVYVLVNSDASVETVYRVLVGAIHAAGPDYDAGDPALIDALHTLQLVCWWSGREEVWAPFFEVIDKLGPALPPVLAMAARSFPDPARTGLSALPWLDELRTLMREANDPTTLVRGATATVYLDRVGEIRDRLWDLVHSGRDGGGPHRRHIGSLMHLCMDDFLTGEWEEGQQLVDEGLALCAAGYPFFAWYFQFNQVLLHGARGEAEAGNALAEEMVRWATRRGVGAAAAFAHQAHALVCMGSGDYEAAYTHATALAPAGTLAPYAPMTLWGIFDLVEAAMRTGRRQEALAHLQTLRELKIDQLSDRYAMIVAGAAGLVAKDEQAIVHFRDALAVPGADRWVFEAARIRLALGERLRRIAARSEAREPLTTALKSFTRLGAKPWVERAAKELRAAGQATGPVTNRVPLTPQELEIAQLAATGMTNKQIGERLYLSHRTVGAHLYQVFPKLGITTRTALHNALMELNDGM
ncbi:AAA family ATPase [Streptomyces sp. NPDC051286]|uniref:AAA family ATPase n=1 Tax=Streptomyces sp. NPDC051286 TaxID=3365647 RepID=UPI00379CDE66